MLSVMSCLLCQADHHHVRASRTRRRSACFMQAKPVPPVYGETPPSDGGERHRARAASFDSGWESSIKGACAQSRCLASERHRPIIVRGHWWMPRREMELFTHSRVRARMGGCDHVDGAPV